MIAASLAAALSLVACKKDPHEHGHAAAPSAETPRVAAGGTITVRVDGSGYHPSRIAAAPGSDVTLAFIRTTDECCGQQLKIPSLNITRDLPLNQSVAVQVHVPPSGQLGFTCGMDMYRGSVVVH